MTRDIDIVIALVLKDLKTLPQIFGDDFYFSAEAARVAPSSAARSGSLARRIFILSKLDWSRESQSQRQLSDVENLLATGADKTYLHTWSQKLNLTDMLTLVSP
jgi:hypothetical protein